MYLTGVFIFEQEIWKDIIGFDRYQISNFGRIKSKDKSISDTAKRIYLHKGRILKQTQWGNKDNYFLINLKKDNRTICFYVHRLVGLYFIDNKDNKPLINHKDGNKLNNHYKNLEWATYSDNLKHAIETGLNNKSKIFKIKLNRDKDIKIGKDETFLDIKGEEGNYKISNYGRVLSLSRELTDIKGRKFRVKERFLRFFKAGEGYYYVTLAQKKRFIIHRLVASHFILNPHNLPTVNHKDGNKLNNYYKNLEWSTQSNNNKHMWNMYKDNYNKIKR